MIKIISFDFWDTLFQGKDENSTKRTEKRAEIILNFSKKINSNIEYLDVVNAIKKSWSYFEYIWLNLNRTLTTKELILFILNELELIDFSKSDLEFLKEELSNIILQYPPKFTQDNVPEILQKLSSKYKLAIISDTGFSNGKTLREFLKIKDIYKYFSEFSFSDELNSAKPQKKVYLNILKSYSPENLIHVGDLIETDVTGAKNIGAYAVLYSGKFKKMDLNKNNFSKSFNIKPDFSINDLNQLLKIVEKIH